MPALMCYKAVVQTRKYFIFLQLLHFVLTLPAAFNLRFVNGHAHDDEGNILERITKYTKSNFLLKSTIMMLMMR